MSNAQEHQTALAKLLSTENITVRHGNFSTAFFDLKDRILGLPIWKDKGKDVYDLLVGHEVGHALFTPRVNLDKLNLIKAYVNVIEDIRIEKMIQAKYPGLIASFRRAYSILHKEDFFGIAKSDPAKIFLVDRLNIHAKVGIAAGMKFSAAELPVVTQCLSVETWKDVLAAAKALEDFIREEIRKKQEAAKKAAEEAAKKAAEEAAKKKAEKEAKEKAAKKSKEDSQDEGDSDGEGDEKSEKNDKKKSGKGKGQKEESEEPEQQVGHNDALDESAGLDKDEDEKKEKSRSSKPSDEDSDEDEDSDDEDGDGAGDDEDSDEDADSEDDGAGDDEDGDSDEETDKNGDPTESDGDKDNSFKDGSNDDGDKDGTADLKNEDELSKGSPSGDEGHASPATELPEVKTQSSFDQMASELVDKSKGALTTTSLQNPAAEKVKDVIVPNSKIAEVRAATDNLRSMKADPKRMTGYIDFLKETKKYVNVIAKEFELRKAAFQYSRAKTAQTGSLNMNRIHSYRYNDDIFLRTMQMADAKSHGMMMFIDYSGSMSDVIHNVARQLINLVLFCRQVGIPFQVYGFTDHNEYLRPKNEMAAIHHREGDIQIEDTCLLDLINSKMSKAQMNTALEDLYFTTIPGGCTKADALGGTPLNETIIMAHRLVKDFQLKNNIQKMNVVILTDGEGNRLQYHVREEYDKYRSTGPATSDPYGAGGKVAAAKGDIILNGKKVTLQLNSYRTQDNTAILLENLKATTGCKVIGFFIPKDMNAAFNEASRFDSSVRSTVSPYYNRFRKQEARNWNPKAYKAYTENKVLIFENKHGYDLYSIVAAGRDLNVVEAKLEAHSDMTRGQLVRAFDEFSSAKKTNRVFITKFAEVVS